MPKQFLHDAVANHKDEVTVDKCASQTTIAKLPIYCHCDNIVIESPFLGDASQVEIILHPVYIVFEYRYTGNYYSLHYSHYNLRGPPSPAAFIV